MPALEEELASQGEISHSSDNLSDHLGHTQEPDNNGSVSDEREHTLVRTV